MRRIKLGFFCMQHGALRLFYTPLQQQEVSAVYPPAALNGVSWLVPGSPHLKPLECPAETLSGIYSLALGSEGNGAWATHESWLSPIAPYWTFAQGLCMLLWCVFMRSNSAVDAEPLKHQEQSSEAAFLFPLLARSIFARFLGITTPCQSI